VLAVAALALAVPFGPWFWLFTAVGLAAGIAYDARLKYTALSWLPFSVAFPTLPLWAWAGAAPGGELPARLFWILPVGGVLVVGIHLADTIPDLATDSGAGVEGLAHRLGPGRALAVCWVSFAVGVALTVALWAFVPYRAEWYLPGLLAAVGLMSAGVASYFVSGARLRQMALLLEMGAMALAVGWLGGLML
jgi:4-hydroxybenzoate polyprenyltransferase